MTVLRAGGPDREVLVTDGGDGQGRSALAAVRALDAAGFRTSVTTSGPPADSLAAASRHRADAVAVPPADHPDFPGALGDLVAGGRFGWVVPASDAAVLALRPALVDVVDKVRWADRAAAVGLRTPETTVVADPAALADLDVTFPVVVKPAVGRQPARRVDGPAGWDAVDAEGPLLVQPYLSEPLRAMSVVVGSGRLLAAVHQRYLRTWPVDCGTSSLAVTVPPDRDLEAKALGLLEGFDGIAQLQLSGTRLLDVNARVYGSLPLAVRAGVNLPAVAIGAARGDVPATVLRGRVGVVYRWIEGDLRHLAAVVRGRPSATTRVLAALMPHAGAAHSVWAAGDPKPALVRLRVALARAGQVTAGGRGRG